MVQQFLIPRVQHAEEADLRPEASHRQAVGARRGSKPFKAIRWISREHCAKHFANLVIGVLKCESL
jgi:hypothetical protein